MRRWTAIITQFSICYHQSRYFIHWVLATIPCSNSQRHTTRSHDYDGQGHLDLGWRDRGCQIIIQEVLPWIIMSTGNVFRECYAPCYAKDLFWSTRYKKLHQTFTNGCQNRYPIFPSFIHIFEFVLVLYMHEIFAAER